MNVMSNVGRSLLIIAACGYGQKPPILVGSGNGSPSFKVVPGQVVSLQVVGMKQISPPSSNATTMPLPTMLAGISVNFEQSYMLSGPYMFPAPILAVQQSPIGDCDTCFMTTITVQVPSELDLGVANPAEHTNPHNAVVITQDGGGTSASSIAGLLPQNPRVVMCGDSKKACVTHLDGALVSHDLPGKPGEVVVIYAYGLATSPVATGLLTPAPSPDIKVDVAVALDFSPNAGPKLSNTGPIQPTATPLFVGLTPGQIGLWQINVKLPNNLATLSTCPDDFSSNLTVDLYENVWGFPRIWISDAAPICVQPQSQ